MVVMGIVGKGAPVPDSTNVPHCNFLCEHFCPKGMDHWLVAGKETSIILRTLFAVKTFNVQNGILKFSGDISQNGRIDFVTQGIPGAQKTFVFGLKSGGTTKWYEVLSNNNCASPAGTFDKYSQLESVKVLLKPRA